MKLLNTIILVLIYGQVSAQFLQPDWPNENYKFNMGATHQVADSDPGSIPIYASYKKGKHQFGLGPFFNTTKTHNIYVTSGFKQISIKLNGSPSINGYQAFYRFQPNGSEGKRLLLLLETTLTHSFLKSRLNKEVFAYGSSIQNLYNICMKFSVTNQIALIPKFGIGWHSTTFPKHEIYEEHGYPDIESFKKMKIIMGFGISGEIDLF